MGWFHLFSKIKVVGNNFLSEQTVGWLIIFGMVVNRGFFAAHRLCCLAAAAAWGFPELLVLHQAQPQLSLRKAVLPGLGWPRSSLESALRTEHQGSVEEILKQNCSSFSPKHLIICICRAKPGWGVSTGTTRSRFGVGISHLGCQRKCLPVLSSLCSTAAAGMATRTWDLFTFHRNTSCFNLHQAISQNFMILGQNSRASHPFQLTAKTGEKSNVLCKPWHESQYFHSS